MNFSLFRSTKPASGRPAKRFDCRSWHGQWVWMLFLEVATVLGLALNAPAATYYVDFSSGSDANNGTSTNTPWQRCPGMAGFSGSYSHASGDVFIFKGGVTWTSGCFPLNISTGGTGGNDDTYESSTNWYSGSSWTNATFDLQYAFIGQHNQNSAVAISAPYVTVRGLEIKNLSVPVLTNWNAWGVGSIADAGNGNITVQGCYIHDWKPTGYGDSDFGGIFFLGGGSAAIQNRIGPGDAEDGYTGNCGVGVHGGDLVQSNDITGCTEMITGNATNISYNVLHDSLNSFCTGYHANVLYHDVSTGQSTFIYGNRIHDVGSTYMTMLLHVGTGGATGTRTYIYNNIIWNTPNSIDIDDWQISSYTPDIRAYVYNNILLNEGVAAGYRSAPYHITEIDCVNNLWINDAAQNPFWTCDVVPTYSGCVDVRVDTNNVWISNATAAADGYTVANMFAPTSPTSPTVGQGSNLTSLGVFTTDINGNPRPATVAWDVGAYKFKAALSWPAPVVSLVALPTTITSGQSSTLIWSAVNATNVTLTTGFILNGFGQVLPAGTTNVWPNGATTYTLTAAGTNWVASTNVTITITGAPVPPSELTTNAPSIQPGF